MITVKYFGAIAEKTNSKSEEFLFSELPLSQLLDSLEKKHQWSSMTFSVAVNKTIITNAENCMLKSNDEVALLPPFAGG